MAHNGAEHGLKIESRADRLTDLTQRSQFPNRLSQLARTRFQFLEEPHVLDSDHCLVGEGFQELDLCRRKGADLGAACRQRSNDVPPLTKRSRQVGVVVAGGTERWKVALIANIRNVERAVLAYPAILRSFNTQCFAASRYGHGTKMSPNDLHVPFNEPQYYVINPANPRGALGDSVEDWLHVRRRAADNTEHFRGRRLMLQRFAQFGVTFLDFFEQPNVFDRDHRLRSKGLQQLDLLIGKGTNFHPADHDRPDWDTLAQQRRGEYCPNAETSGKARSEISLWFCGEVMNVNGLTVNHSSAGNIAPAVDRDSTTHIRRPGQGSVISHFL